MPGILPMKVIKVGTTAQSRIAQACDRCRSKKIRCDGITPCCSQCTNVGFKCKTSDKLSRRAFPRGYTESLEERVRTLENEVKELKDLLDEKDEKIDMLSRINSNSASLRSPSSSLPSSTDATSFTKVPQSECSEDDVFRVYQPPNMFDRRKTNLHVVGASSGRSFADAFRTKLQESGKAWSDFRTEALFAFEGKSVSPRSKKDKITSISRVPPRMVSDQMMNIFFQEWAPLFPILHRPTVLRLYSDFVTNPKSVKDQQSIAQLNLVFGIAALSTEWNKQNADCFESEWQSALNNIAGDISLPTLQCLVLAQMYCIVKGDQRKLIYYRGLAVAVSHHLGLHRSQKGLSLSALTGETRKRVFWTLYTLDCFSAALVGLPKMLNECDIHAEFPADIDDENVSEEGFESTLPGESTRLSSALALFRLCRIMSKVLDENYPAVSSYELSLRNITALNDELDSWLGSLPSHLCLQFVQDRPSTNIVGSRSPLLSLAYHYIKTLIHRPVVGSCLGAKASFSVVALAQSSKHIVQIIRLLEERQMSFSFCLNKNELLIFAGFGLLFQTLDLDRKGKLIQDSQRLLCSIIESLESNAASGATEFKKIACAMISIDRFAKSARALDDANNRRASDSEMPAPKDISKSARKTQAMASRLSTSSSPPLKQEIGIARRFTAPNPSTNILPVHGHSDSHHGAISILSDRVKYPSRARSPKLSFYKSTTALPNLDYLDFSHEANFEASQSLYTNKPQELERVGSKEWSDFHMAQTTSDNLIPPDEPFSYLSPSPPIAPDWCQDIWTIQEDLPQHTQSALSFSEEDLTSGEEFSSCDTHGQLNSGLPVAKEDGILELDRVEGNISL